MSYEKEVQEELSLWKLRLLKRPSIWQRKSKDVQSVITARIPKKVHAALTESIRLMTEITIKGSQWTNGEAGADFKTLEEKDEAIRALLSRYKKTAAFEGAATGAGGFAAGMADFPLLFGIKMKFLYEAASIYGFPPKSLEERLYILMIFQLAFSSSEVKLATLEILEKWPEAPLSAEDMDWQQFQQEYRDHIDLVKMLQLVPGIGAAVGGAANFRLLGELGETAMKVYQMRILNG
ncbi:EcsC family protein [Bacillus sp. FJAT-42376]|uniref:EcsC family protein n=1 Tax=Bacillus sp. FJAT-42376 TaxID=2014076 RepID=UPI000F4DBEE8|nr:EcsC family protein [Bacillus sp. FJAT-42376]AZB42246.1 EcsC family protein [Bacillus sp. FJAT-42376]